VFFLGATILATPGYFLLSTARQSFVDDVIAVGAAGAMFAGTLHYRPHARFAWLLMAFGVLLFAGGDIVYGTTQPVPSVADMFYVSGYALLALGLLALARSKLPGRNDSRLLDALAVAGSIGILGLLFLAVPAARPGEADAAAKAVALGYPLADLALLAILNRPVRSVTARGMPLVLIAAALGLRLVADVWYAALNFGTEYVVGQGADAAWILSFGCFGAALLHPTIAREGALTWTSQTGFGAALSGAWASAQVAPSGSVLPGLAAQAAEAAEASSAAIRARPITRSQALRFRVVTAWAGAGLVVLAAVSLLAGGSWDAGDVILLGGAYATTGAFAIVASVARG
jgi:hypothetical protein